MLDAAPPLLLVGAGKMGGAMLGAWLSAGLAAGRVTVVDPQIEAARRNELGGRGVFVADSLDMAPRDQSFGIIVLAVKPQAMADVLRTTAPLADTGSLVVSIAAGVRLGQYEVAFPKATAIVRAMPNTPAQIGRGMTVALANAAVTPAQRGLAQALLAACGDVAWIDDEALMDAVTAVSGSGPAYVFLLAECLAEAGREAGLPAELAERLARRTVAGAGALLGGSPLAAATLRRDVTSPNGTTAAALSVLMAEEGMQRLVTRAVAAARRRSIELG